MKRGGEGFITPEKREGNPNRREREMRPNQTNHLGIFSAKSTDCVYLAPRLHLLTETFCTGPTPYTGPYAERDLISEPICQQQMFCTGPTIPPPHRSYAVYIIDLYPRPIKAQMRCSFHNGQNIGRGGLSAGNPALCCLLYDAASDWWRIRTIRELIGGHRI
jgi:hypothetical protein